MGIRIIDIFISKSLYLGKSKSKRNIKADCDENSYIQKLYTTFYYVYLKRSGQVKVLKFKVSEMQ